MFSFSYNGIDFSHKKGIASEPMDDFGKHLHPFNEILIFLNGDVTYNVESRSRKLEEGDLVIIKQGLYHFADISKSETYERYVFKFPVSVLPHFVEDKLETQSPFLTNVKKYLMLLNQFDSYYGNYSDEETYYLFISELTKLLIMMLKEPTRADSNSDDVITRLIEYIDENIQSNISLDTLSREFNYSKSYISNEFKNNMKIPVMQYVRYKKIIAAHQMILAGAKKSVVAELLDFNDYSTFYRSYVKIIGHAPTDRN